MRKPSKVTMMKKCDKLAKEIVFLRDGHCVTCPLWIKIKGDKHRPSQVMQPGHYITRGSKSVRWYLRNVYQQCSTCNFIHELHPEVMAQYVKGVLGDRGFEELVFDGNQSMPSIHTWQLEVIYKQFEVILKDLQHDS